MLETLPAKFRAYDLRADVRTLLTFRKAVERGLVKTLGDMYALLKSLVAQEPSKIGPFTRAFYDYFLNIDIENGDTLHDAILRSETFRQWRQDLPEGGEWDVADLVSQFIDAVHLTHYDIHEIISGKELWDRDNPDLADTDGDDSLDIPEKYLDRMADYSDLSLEELLERMREVLRNQKGKHAGGSHWIGTGGISPYGHGGGAKNGIRVGGTGGGKMARRVMGDARFFPVDRDSILSDNNVDAALSALKGIVDESAEESLDVPLTIKQGIKRGGLFIPELKNVTQEKLQVLLLIDNGGYSMDPYIHHIKELFKKMKTRFSHDLETYYFHNTIYNAVFSDVRRTKMVSLKKLLDKDPNYRVFIIGDASMSPYELSQGSMANWHDLQRKFKRIAWLNPEPEHHWNYTMTISVLRQIFEMYPLTPAGIERAVVEMNRKTGLARRG